MKKTIKIEGMSCEHCAKKIENALKNIDGIKSVKVHLKKKEAIISTDKLVSDETLKSTIENLGYQITMIQ